MSKTMLGFADGADVKLPKPAIVDLPLSCVKSGVPLFCFDDDDLKVSD